MRDTSISALLHSFNGIDGRFGVVIIQRDERRGVVDKRFMDYSNIPFKG